MATRSWGRNLLASVVVAVGLLQTAHAQTLNVGDKAPAFALPASSAKEIKLADYAGKKSLVLFFYYGAFTGP